MSNCQGSQDGADQCDDCFVPGVMSCCQDEEGSRGEQDQGAGVRLVDPGVSLEPVKELVGVVWWWIVVDRLGEGAVVDVFGPIIGIGVPVLGDVAMSRFPRKVMYFYHGQTTLSKR